MAVVAVVAVVSPAGRQMAAAVEADGTYERCRVGGYGAAVSQIQNMIGEYGDPGRHSCN